MTTEELATAVAANIDPVDPTKSVTEQTGGVPLEDDSHVSVLDFITGFQHLLKIIDLISGVLPIQTLKDLDIYVKGLEKILAKIIAAEKPAA